MDQADTSMDSRHPAERVAERLHAAAIHLLRRLRRQDEALGISAARLSALSVVGFTGPRTLGELAAAEQVTAPTMTRMVAALEAAGLVTRTPDPGDRRVSRISITPEGWEVLERGRARRNARLARDLASLNTTELESLERAALILERLLETPAGRHPAIDAGGSAAATEPRRSGGGAPEED
jgi:DNA-binding MarR family transcriptional regulator